MEMIYVDESGDHADGASNPEYPVFVIVACVFDDNDYRLRFVPDLMALKIKYWSHEAVVLHEREIRKNQGEFAFLFDRSMRERFLADLSLLVRISGAEVLVVAWDKRKVSAVKTYADCLLLLLNSLQSSFQRLATPQVIILESRGVREDLEIRRAVEGSAAGFRWRPIFVPKARNLAGLQLADLCARPIGLKLLRPDRPNRAYDETISLLMRKTSDGTRPGLIVLD